MFKQLICNGIDIPPKSPFGKGGLGAASVIMELYGQGSVPYCSVVEREFEVKRACNQLICNGIDIPPKSPFEKGGLGAASVIMELYGQGSVPNCSVVEREFEVRYENQSFSTYSSDSCVV